MRLDARLGDTGYEVYDAERMALVDGVVWVDDTLAQYAQYDRTTLPDPLDGWPTVTRQAKRIRILVLHRLVIVNPIDDASDATQDADALALEA